jgi:hypothetical protein
MTLFLQVQPWISKKNMYIHVLRKEPLIVYILSIRLFFRLMFPSQCLIRKGINGEVIYKISIPIFTLVKLFIKYQLCKFHV